MIKVRQGNRVELEDAKHRYLCQYNRQVDGAWDRDLALASGIRAAAQHNPLYARGLSDTLKDEIRGDWKRHLEETVAKYAQPTSSDAYEADIQCLAETMNGRHGNRLRHELELPTGYAPGFRVSHAQKSLSVFLKHLWCMNAVAMPPQCPIDRFVLYRSGVGGAWTRVCSTEEHHRLVEQIRSHVGGQPLSEWELFAFLT